MVLTDSDISYNEYWLSDQPVNNLSYNNNTEPPPFSSRPVLSGFIKEPYVVNIYTRAYTPTCNTPFTLKDSHGNVIDCSGVTIGTFDDTGIVVVDTRQYSVVFTGPFIPGTYTYYAFLEGASNPFDKINIEFLECTINTSTSTLTCPRSTYDLAETVPLTVSVNLNESKTISEVGTNEAYNTYCTGRTLTITLRDSTDVVVGTSTLSNRYCDSGTVTCGSATIHITPPELGAFTYHATITGSDDAVPVDLSSNTINIVKEFDASGTTFTAANAVGALHVPNVLTLCVLANDSTPLSIPYTLTVTNFYSNITTTLLSGTTDANGVATYNLTNNVFGKFVYTVTLQRFNTDTVSFSHTESVLSGVADVSSQTQLFSGRITDPFTNVDLNTVLTTAITGFDASNCSFFLLQDVVIDSDQSYYEIPNINGTVPTLSTGEYMYIPRYLDYSIVINVNYVYFILDISANNQITIRHLDDGGNIAPDIAGPYSLGDTILNNFLQYVAVGPNCIILKNNGKAEILDLIMSNSNPTTLTNVYAITLGITLPPGFDPMLPSLIVPGSDGSLPENIPNEAIIYIPGSAGDTYTTSINGIGCSINFVTESTFTISIDSEVTGPYGLLDLCPIGTGTIKIIGYGSALLQYFSEPIEPDPELPGPSSGVTCFLADAPVLTPTGYRKISGLRVGDLVLAADGRPVPIEAVKIQHVKPSPSVNPYVIPKGRFGATRELLISPEHKVQVGDKMVEARYIGLEQRGMADPFDYYNLELPDYEKMVVAGVIVESLYPIILTYVTPTDYAHMLYAKYGDAASQMFARLRSTLRVLPNGTIVLPVDKRVTRRASNLGRT